MSVASMIDSAHDGQAFLVESETGAVECVGNRTECALLLMLQQWGHDYRKLRSEHEAGVVEVYGFSSERKMASVLIRRHDGSLRLYNKVPSAFLINMLWAASGWHCTVEDAGIICWKNWAHGSKHLSSMQWLPDTRCSASVLSGWRGTHCGCQ